MEKNVLYATQIQYLKNLTIDEYEILKLLCKASNSLYNVALYNVRQNFFQTKKYLSYNENYKLSKCNENYEILNSNMSQQILREVDNNFKSFFALLNKKTNGNYSSKVKIPHYKEKDGFYKLKIQQIQIDEDGYMLLPMSVSFRKTYGSMKFKVPSNLNYSKIKYVEVIPMFHSKRFELHWVYETQIENTNNLLDETKYLSIDLGVNNLMTCVSNDGFAFIIDGKKLKSINQYVNKRNAFLQSIRTTQKNNNPLDEKGNMKYPSSTKQLNNLWKFRNNYVNNYLHKACLIPIRYCLEHNVKNIVLGYNEDFQQNTKMGRVSNQNFVNIPFGKIKDILTFLSIKFGLNLILQEESYTSKASFLDKDDIPTYVKGNNTKYDFSGNRIKRGLYKTKDGITLNADVNGALNILRKAIQTQGLNCLISIPKIPIPKRIRVVGT